MREPGLDPAARLQLRLDLPAAAARAFGTGEVDVVLLNGATPLMRHRAIRDARRLVERDGAERVRLETRDVLLGSPPSQLRLEAAGEDRQRLLPGSSPSVRGASIPAVGSSTPGAEQVLG